MVIIFIINILIIYLFNYLFSIVFNNIVNFLFICNFKNSFIYEISLIFEINNIKI